MPAPYAAAGAGHPFLADFDSGIFSAGWASSNPARRCMTGRVRVRPVAARTLFFDDVAHNVESACEQGWQAVLFTGAGGAEQALRTHGLLA